MKLTLAELAIATNGVLQGDEKTVVEGVTFDSRKVQPGDLFVALVGENDGHDYIQMAMDKGAKAVLAQEGHVLPAAVSAVVVPDSLTGLQELSQYYLKEVAPKVVAITGSNGKTTTKDMVASILSEQYKTFKTPANFNNEIGLPVTILSMPEETEILVLEMGMDRPGQLTALSTLAQPDIAVITMIGEAHLEFFKTRANIAKAKLEITAGLKKDGLFLIPADEDLLTKAKNLPANTKTFGPVPSDIKESLSETVWTEAGQQFAIPMLGRYNVKNAEAAIMVGQACGLTLKTMASALAHFDLTKNRTEILTATNGAKIISDVYNANPTATKEVLAAIAKDGVKEPMIVLGDMLELGEQGPALHADLASSILKTKPKEVKLVGPLMVDNLLPVLKEKAPALNVKGYQSDQLLELITDLKAELSEEDLVFLKASHGIHLEKVLASLIGKPVDHA
ncbi:UDP-N-acetylmuramoyl-tripeptide--D-alanyl-D-alanine ligase [Fructobacillus sp. M1-13]|uniref:UDP-N-acetylmuramoyl-tripeptide--D-alanyl-D-alanine ligase n=1 Tax=Fructobacillus papyriferae TaxID=2713171 RepID=A0ABS5QQB7_9LACO|nr:UDP-N-acetylmuramoyl-tripeptide--D-alanyl-D-alanine ligase [Fructobacillus papyriferae]MBS9335378.1 UDP-N-acetylmuramoyl-tripeptide--D-alanyl-D-alanine ligase [Fructobacillus papyriferae]MCD2158952.1 UDP-N-acetylmuramoyl-tripeptide--D-alanyl-D-alanine ligase [Fructobacillus papyriferae]